MFKRIIKCYTKAFRNSIILWYYKNKPQNNISTNHIRANTENCEISNEEDSPKSTKTIKWSPPKRTNIFTENKSITLSNLENSRLKDYVSMSQLSPSRPKSIQTPIPLILEDKTKVPEPGMEDELTPENKSRYKFISTSLFLIKYCKQNTL